jgi:hypothetical protein
VVCHSLEKMAGVALKAGEEGGEADAASYATAYDCHPHSTLSDKIHMRYFPSP